MCRGPAEAALFSRGQRLALMCFLWKTCSGPKGNSHQTALFHPFLSALFLSIRVPQNSHIKWNRGLDEWLATDTNQPTSGYCSSTAWLLCFGSLPLFFGHVKWWPEGKTENELGLVESIFILLSLVTWESQSNQMRKGLNSPMSHFTSLYSQKQTDRIFMRLWTL